MRYLAAAALLASLTACSAAPDRMGIGYSRGGMAFGGTPDAWGGFEADLDAYSLWFEWDLHRPVSDEVRALRDDMRRRHHEMTVAEEAEADRAAIIREAAERAQAEPIPDDPGRWDWLFDNVEVWVMVLAGILGILWRVGVWVGRAEAEKETTK